MKRIRRILGVFLALSLIFAMPVSPVAMPVAQAGDGGITPYGLLTNQLEHPWNVPQEEYGLLDQSLPSGPNFSWYLSGAGVDQVQTAYQIVVTDEISGAVAWDSGKVASGEQNYVLYAGPTLLSGHPYSWKVRAWNGNDAVGDYSESAHFATGFADSEWQADWLATSVTSTVTFFYARKEQELEKTDGKVPVRALAYVAMEHEYELNVNGERIGHGGTWDWNSEQRYQGWDITDAVLSEQDSITLALICQWKSGGQGRATSINALIGRFEIYYSDGSQQTIVTDDTWRIVTGDNTPHPNHTGARNSGEGLRQDRYNATREPNVEGWKEPGYVMDSLWIVPNVRGTHPAMGTGTGLFNHLIADMRHIEETVVYPVAMHQWTEGPNAGVTVVDFGTVIPAHVNVHFGSVNTTSDITLRSAYQLTGYSYTRSGPMANRANVAAWPARVATANQQATTMTYLYTPKDGDQTYNEFDYISFRYLEIPNVGYTFQEGDIWATILTSEVPKGRDSKVETSDDVLNDVFGLLKRSATYSAQYGFVDTPTREQGQFLQDGINVGAALMTATYDREMNRKAIMEFLSSADRFWNLPGNVNTGAAYWDGRYNAVYPNNDGASGARDIPDYSLNMPLWIWGYYMQSGDIETLRYAYPYMQKTLGYVQHYTPTSGAQADLVVNLGGGGNKQAAEFTAVSNYCFGIVDWPANGRFGYTRVAGSAWSSINMLTVQFYDLMADTARELGDTANIAVYEGYAQTLRDRINETFLTNNTASDIDQNGVSRWKYADNVTSAGAQNNHFGQHSTSYALAFDIAPQEYRESMLDYIASLGMRQGPMTVNYLVEAFCENNRPVDLLNLLTNPDDLGWAHALLHQNFTYSPEEWEPYSGTNSFGNSESHGWGAASIVEMYEYVAGVKNAEAGGKSIIINPFMSGALDWVDGVVYTSRGPVTTSYSGEGADLTLKIDVPPNIQAEVLMPIVENGVFVEKNGLDGESEFTDDYQIISVGSGVREFVYERRIYANIRSDEALAGINSPVSYTVSLTDAIGAGVVSLSFIADSRYLDLPTATALNGFTILEPLSWEYIGAQLWKGSIKLYCPNFVQSSDPVDILRISGVTLGLLGNTTVTLSDVKATGDISGYSGDIPCVITVGDATINIVLRTVFSKYDLNHDGKIDELDLAIVVYYYLANDLESDWAVVKFDIASAKDCDVAVNGRVDLADMIEVIANYCDSY